MTFEEWWNTKDYPDCCLLRCKRAFNEGRADLEEENEKLKEKLNFSTQYYQGEKAKDQLTKAKEIIKDLMSFSVQLCDCRHTIDFEKTREQAEQFLKEIEK